MVVTGAEIRMGKVAATNLRDCRSSYQRRRRSNWLSRSSNFVFGGRGVPSAYAGAPAGVSASGATLTASVYTGGVLDTRYHFEYGPTREYGSYSAEGDAGAATGAVPASMPIAGLSAGTKYHYRVVAWNAEGSSDEGPSAGLDRTFRTSRAAP